jgi:hypothetical protein
MDSVNERRRLVMNREETTTPIEDRNRFVEHLERASETVRSWPVWKQTILGGIEPGDPGGGTVQANGTGSAGSNSEDTG